MLIIHRWLNPKTEVTEFISTLATQKSFNLTPVQNVLSVKSITIVNHKDCWHRCMSICVCCHFSTTLFSNSLWYRGILRQTHWPGSAACSNMSYIINHTHLNLNNKETVVVLTPQLIVVATALRLSTAVARLTEIGLVVHADAPQLALPEKKKLQKRSIKIMMPTLSQVIVSGKYLSLEFLRCGHRMNLKKIRSWGTCKQSASPGWSILSIINYRKNNLHY